MMKQPYSINDGLKFFFQKRCSKKQGTQKEFPSIGEEWLEKYLDFERHIKNYHDNVNLGIAITDGTLLTDHGLEHVNCVIRNAAEIIDPKTLTGYEMYILLHAIHFHDVGNIHGRNDHEKKIVDIMSEKTVVSHLNQYERNFIKGIAMAHGGYFDGNDKDTIVHLPFSETYGGIEVRVRALASILRFADEISDSLNRSEFDGISIPDENKKYHDYSKALAPLTVKGNTIILEYYLSYEQTQTKLPLSDETPYLYDFILDRLAKTMRELEYCRKYSEGLIRITTLDVRIQMERKDGNLIAPIVFRLTLQGYPGIKESSIDKYMVKNSSIKMPCEDGEALKSLVSKSS